MKQGELRPVDQMGDAVLVPSGLTAEPDPLATALQVLRERTEFDFSGYRRGMLQRRLQRRMGLGHVVDLGRYVERLREDPAEIAALRRDLLVSVSRFFREPQAWQVLQERVIRPMVAAKADGAPLRAWTPACATGEEAYSLAMVLIEELEAAGKTRRLQLFASDVDGAALQTARAGFYRAGIAAQMSARRLARFFTRSERGYQVTRALRDAVVFTQQNLIADPPFSRLDVVTCRNLLICLEPALQERLVPLLHYALLDGGCLFLGSAEDVGGHADLFEPLSSGWRLYRRVGPPRHARLQFPRSDARASRGWTAPPPPLASLAPRLLLQRFAPACAIINRAREILYLHGRTDDYLTRPGALPARDLIARARPGLRAPLRAAILGALREQRRVVVRAVPVGRGSAARRVTVSVEPLVSPHTDRDHLWLVSLEDDITIASPAGADTAAATAGSARSAAAVLEGATPPQKLARALRIGTIGRLASGLAHELNQPLSAIANSVEACARYVRAGTTGSAELLALLDDAAAEALRAGSIVAHLRHFIEKGQPQFEATDLCEITRNIPRLLGRELRGAQVTLRIDVASRPLPIRADRVQIEQILVNLMQNAIDAIREAPHDGAEIELRVWAARRMAEVAVRDTGSGASAAATERMFEPFFSTKPQGLGMGLAISRSIIEAHRGRIWVQAGADRARGTTVRFTLPRLVTARAGRKRPGV